MPIKATLTRLSTGIRTPVGLKISGSDLKTIEEIGTKVQVLLPSVGATGEVFAERTQAEYFLDVNCAKNSRGTATRSDNCSRDRERQPPVRAD